MGIRLALLITSYLVQIAGGAALALVLLALYRRYERRFLLYWAWSWLALSVYLLGATTVLLTAPAFEPRHPVRLLSSATTMVAGYWQVGWLLAGTLWIARKRAPSRRALAWAFAVLAALALVLIWPFSADPGARTERLFLRVGLRALVAGGAFLYTAALVRREARGRGFGPRAMTLGFVAYGLEQLHYFGMELAGVLGFTGQVFGYAVYLGFADFLMQWLIGLGMVGWLLEEERERVERVSVELRRARDELRRGEAQWRALADGAPVLLWMTDEKGQFVFFNRAWRDFLGDELPDPPVKDMLAFVHPDDAEASRKAFLRALEAGETVSLQFRLRDENGAYHWMLGMASPRRDPEGQFAGLVGSCADITELRRLQEQLLQAQKLETVGRLAGGVAHDFNNLLTVIVGHLELASASVPPDSPLRRHLEPIADATERAARLVQQLLAFARRQIVRAEPVRVGELLHGLDSMLRRSLGEDIELVTLLSDEEATTLADPVQLEQVILNLAVNARDAMPEGGRLTISVESLDLAAPQPGFPSTVPPGGYVRISVRDTGSGIPREILPYIFEPFFTTKGPDKGTGLGLSTCYGIVEQCGGAIQVESRPGLGATFLIYLPRTAAPAPRQAHDASARKPSGSVTGRVMLVEDESETRELMGHVLRSAGYTVLVHSDGREALAALEACKGKVDLLVTDVIMPGMSGRELADRVRRRWPALPILFISGYAAEQELAICGDGPRQWLVKPFTPGALLDAVTRLIASVQPRQP